MSTNMSTNTEKQVLVITGGFGALGRSAAREAVSAGWQVALVDLAAAPAHAELGLAEDALLLGEVDLTDLGSAEQAIAAVVGRFGRVDALFNIAGGFVWETFADNTLDAWDRLFRLNVKTAVTASKAVIPEMQRQGGGSIVCVSAAATLKADMGMGPYTATKSGVSRFVEAAAAEFKGQNIRVNAVLPSVIDTAPNREAMADANFDDWVKPQALARVMLFLVSEDAAPITGALLPVVNKV